VPTTTLRGVVGVQGDELMQRCRRCFRVTVLSQAVLLQRLDAQGRDAWAQSCPTKIISCLVSVGPTSPRKRTHVGMDQCSQQTIPPVVTVSSPSEEGTAVRNGSWPTDGKVLICRWLKPISFTSGTSFTNQGWLFHSH
jgi:hypothetical protein